MAITNTLNCGCAYRLRDENNELSGWQWIPCRKHLQLYEGVMARIVDVCDQKGNLI